MVGMRFSVFIWRSSISVFFIVAITATWFLRGIELTQNSGGHTAPQNAPLTPATSPISSQLLSASSNNNIPAALNSVEEIQIKLTEGLRPGRGQPIPDAADVYELPVVDVAFYNWRGELLSGWLSLSTPETPVIILTHGTPGNRISMLGRAAFLHQHGYNVLLFDFQSYGKSQGDFSTLGMVESEDIQAAISFIHSLPETMYSKIGVLGLSMGATAAVLAASRSDDIAALVAESCPVDATRVLMDVPSEAAREADQQLVQQVYGVDITQARPIDYVGKLAGHTALFFINGDADNITPLSGMDALYQAAADPKQYWIVPGAGHAQSFSLDPQDYIQRVDAFFDTMFA
jgi:dipeptidyl aminopeptidase/acylaminoacyl peptidase